MWMGLNKKHYGIHGTFFPQSIGKMVSHGCIRMYNSDVLELARKVPIGTPVEIKPS
jgi:lipoprotein-anchoring transpeptidase ErfK/SrfK